MGTMTLQTHAGAFTLEEREAMPDDGRRNELIDGVTDNDLFSADLPFPVSFRPAELLDLPAQ